MPRVALNEEMSSEAVCALGPPRKQQQLPSFAVWQAGQLWSRDLLFGAVLAIILLLYFTKTVPRLCLVGPMGCPLQQQGKQQQLLWKLVCGSTPHSLAAPGYSADGILQQCDAAGTCAQQPATAGFGLGTGSIDNPAAQQQGVRLATAAAAKLVSPLAVFMQALVTFFCVGFISCDPFHVVMPPLRSALLLMLLLPLPLPHLPALWRSAAAAATKHTHGNGSTSADDKDSCASSSSNKKVPRAGHKCSSSGSSSWVWWYTPNLWWQYPVIRQGVIAAQRLVPLVAAAVAAGAPHNSLYFNWTMRLMLWSSIGKYIYQGWMQYMFVLPLPLHLACSMCEWLLIYTTSLRLDAAYNAANNMTAAAEALDAAAATRSVTTWLQPWHLVMSLLCVVLLPTLGVARLQQQQRAAYNRIKAAASGEGLREEQQQEQQQQKNASSLSSLPPAKAVTAAKAVTTAAKAVTTAADDGSCSAICVAADDHGLAAINMQLQHMLKQQDAAHAPLNKQTLDKADLSWRSQFDRQQQQSSKPEQQPGKQRQPFLDDSSYDRNYVIMTKGRINSNGSSREPSPEKTLAGWLAGTAQQHQQQQRRMISRKSASTSSLSSCSSGSSSGSSLGASRSSSGPLLLQAGSGMLRRCDSARGSLAPKEDVTCEVPRTQSALALGAIGGGTVAAAAAAAAEVMVAHLPATAGPIIATSNTSIDASKCVRSAAAAPSSSRKKKEKQAGARNSAAEQFLADIESSMALTAPVTAAAPRPGSSSSHPYLSGLMPRISSLLGEEGAAAVFLAAAAAAAPAGPSPGAAMPYYSSMTQAMPASIKVHTAHSNVSYLAPTLTSCLTTGLAGLGSSSAPMQMAAACFPGCVQLLANVFSLKPSDGSNENGGRGGFNGGDGDGGTAEKTKVAPSWAVGDVDCTADGNAAAVLSNVCGALLSLGEGLPEVDVAVGPAAASTQGQETAAAAAAAAPEPSTGRAAAVADSSTGSSVRLEFPLVSLQCCEPACLTSGQAQQQLTLQLQLPAGHPDAKQQQQQQGGDGYQCRLVAFQDGAAVTDQEVTLHGNSISVELPAMPLGVLHVALLPSSSTDADSSSSTTTAAAGKAGSALLLLTPMLVLPAAAAQELQQVWKQATAARAAADSISIADAWSQTIAALTADIAYVLTACSDTSARPAEAAAAGQLPEGVKAVLQQLLTHLATSGMWATMQLLVEAATAAAAAAAAANVGADGANVAGAGQEDTSICSLESATAAAEVANLADAGMKDICSLEPAAADVAAVADAGMEDTNLCSAATEAAAAAADTLTATSSPTSSRSGSGVFEKGSCSRSSSGPLKPTPAAAAAAPQQLLPVIPAESMARPAASMAVTAISLLWGFENSELEDSFLAAAYSSSRAMDLATLVYAAAVGMSCYYTKGGSNQLLQQQQHAAPGLVFRSQLVCLFVCCVGPVVILTHRWVVARKLQALRAQHDKQQQQGGRAAAGGKGGRVSFDAAAAPAAAGNTNSSSTGGDMSLSSSRYAALAQAELVAAARMKQRLWFCWMLIVLSWGLLILSGAGVILEPIVVVKQWSRVGWSDNVGTIVAFALKGWMTQVPLSWFVPLLATEMLLNIIGSIKFGLPLHWMVARYSVCAVLPVALLAMQQVQSRLRFCARNGVRVTGRLMPVLSWA